MIIVGGAAIFFEMDFTGPAFGAAPTWTDITSDVITSPATPGSSAVTSSWGRQDWMGDVTAAAMGVTLINTGKYTPANTASPYFPNVKYGTRAQIRWVISGITVITAGGFVTDVTATPANGTYWTATIDFTDIYGLFSNSTELRGYLVEESLKDAPTYLYPLQEDEGATSFGDITGQAAPAVIANSKYGAGTVEAGDTVTGTFVAGNAVAFTSPDANAGLANSRGSWIKFPNPIGATGAFTVVGWFQVAPSASNQTFWSTAKPDATPLVPVGTIVQVGTTIGNHYVANLTDAAGNTVGVSSNVVNEGNLHDVALTLASDRKTASLYVDGVLARSTVGGTPLGAFNFPDTINVGMEVIGPQLRFPLSGQATYFGFYPAALSSARILAHYQAGALSFQGVDRTDQHVARLLSYRTNYGSVLDVGLGYTGSEDITGETMQTALSGTSAAEGGILYADPLQRIGLRSRAVTFNPTPVLTADVSLGQVDVPTTFRDDVQNVVNDLTVSRPNGADQRAFSPTSIAQVGDYTQSITANVDTDPHAMDIAGWGVAVGTLDQTSSPTLTFDLYALLSRGNTALVLQLLQLRPLDVVKTINNLPQAPASTMQMVVQGGSYSITSESLSLELYTTPLPPKVGVWDSGVAWWDTPSVVWAY